MKGGSSGQGPLGDGIVERKIAAFLEALRCNPQRVIEENPELYSILQQLTTLQEEERKLKEQIEEIKAIQRDLPALEEQLLTEQQKIMGVRAKLSATILTIRL